MVRAMGISPLFQAVDPVPPCPRLAAPTPVRRGTWRQGRMRVLLIRMRRDASPGPGITPGVQQSLLDGGPSRPRVERQAVMRAFDGITCYEVPARVAIDKVPEAAELPYQ